MASKTANDALPDTEAGLEFALTNLLFRPDLADEMKWPAVTKLTRQVRLGNAIADIVLEHADKSVTVIEVKRDGLSIREYATGIGQLAYLGIMVMIQLRAAKVRRVLATPGPISLDLILMADASGIEILPTMTVAQWNASVQEARTALDI